MMGHSKRKLSPPMGHMKSIGQLRNQLQRNQNCPKMMELKNTKCIFTMLIFIFLLNAKQGQATSINYGISQRPITDISQLMPTLCLNQSVICEGSFCIPGLKRCVCDLRQPVQFGRFCLRQVDIETKCFVTNQCNHTIKDAVCIDVSSNTVLDLESSRFKLEQWQQLNELRQASKSAMSNKESMKQRLDPTTNTLVKPMYLARTNEEEQTFQAHDDVIMSSYRNSPYEINYYTPELLHQNHTRRKTNSSDRDSSNLDTLKNSDFSNDTQNDGSRATSSNVTSQSFSNSLMQSIIAVETTTSQTKTTSIATTNEPTATMTTTTSATNIVTSPQNYLNDAKTTSNAVEAATKTEMTTPTSELSKKKMVIKTPNWPPGVCSCPAGFMFDSMLRKCLALSLADSHCQSDNDCKQIGLTHCSSETRKCECDEPLVWNQTELVCQRPRPAAKTDIQANQPKEGFFENLIPPLLMVKILPDQTMLLVVFIIFVIICTLVILRLIVKCFSSNNSALISPKNSKKRKGGGFGDTAGSLMPPKSPYATLRKPEHKPNTPLANFTQAARGRILNYDFEQDNPIPEARSPQSPQAATYVAQKGDQQHHHHHHHYGTLENTSAIAAAGNGTLVRQKQSHKHKSAPNEASLSNSSKRTTDKPADECLELNDNVSLGGQSESKSESTSVLAIPGPPSSQTPPYMLASAMKGQGSAIAAAAAAVANRRMQMAHKKSLTETTATTSGGKVPNGIPVFL